jgi:hypothetical protein
MKQKKGVEMKEGETKEHNSGLSTKQVFSLPRKGI